MSLFKRIDTVFLPVKDFDAAIKWYRNTLGLETRWYDDNSGYAVLEVGETSLTLFRCDAEREVEPGSHPIFNFYAHDIEEVHHTLKERDVAIEPIQDSGREKFFEFKDLEGNTLEVCCFEE